MGRRKSKKDFTEEIKRIAEEGFKLGIPKYIDKDKWFNPVADMGEIHRFEEDYDISLPTSFVRYLTELGNGGTGPGYGIYSLEEMRKRNKAGNKSKQTMLNHSLPDDVWQEFADRYSQIDERIDFADEAEADNLVREKLKLQDELCSGGIFINTPGCTMNILLMCKGEAAGEVFMIDFDYIGQITSEPWCEGKFEDWIIKEMQSELDERIG